MPTESLLSKWIARAPWDLPARTAAIEPAEALERELAHAWTDAGLAAHAAATAQAEFALGALRVGAPAALLRGAARAMLEEAALSAACLELGRKYGAAVSLPPASRRDSTPDVDRNALVLTALRRCCVSAAVEASCAREALEHCQDAEAREVLRQLEQVRRNAAQLGWRFLGWALRDAGRELTDQVRVAVLTGLGAPMELQQWSSRERELARHGVLGPEQRAAIEQRVLRDVVLPCLEHTLAHALAVRSGRAA